MKFKILGGIALMFLISACGNSGGTLTLTVSAPSTGVSSTTGGSGGTTGSSKALLSLWEQSSNYFQLDLRTATMGATSTVTLTAVTGGTCTCQLLIQGTEGSGNMNFSNCSGNFSFGGYSCPTFDGASTYTNASAVLQICAGSNGCTNFN